MRSDEGYAIVRLLRGSTTPAPDTLERADFRDDAPCSTTDPEVFYPEKGGTTLPAKKVCAGCDVRRECLLFALQHDERFGVWGGMSERERRRLRIVPKALPPVRYTNSAKDVCDECGLPFRSVAQHKRLKHGASS
jgi:WhiB family redox-sensing transcriptional regulator